MKLSNEGLKDRKAWEALGYELPEYSRDVMKAKTITSPTWIHFGGGNIFRAFQAHVAQKLLNQGISDRGIVVAEGYDTTIPEKAYHPFDNLSILVTLKSDGSVAKTVIGSIAEAYKLEHESADDWATLAGMFRNPSLQMTSFTITEKGYQLKNAAGELFPAIAADFEAGPEKATGYMGKVSAMLYERYLAGGLPIAMVSMDNCSHNGDKLKEAMVAFAEAWEEKGLCKEGYLAYVTDASKVSFPWTMIDKITPRPDPTVLEILEADGVENVEPVVTGHKSFVAPFVNAEETEYLVIEDDFPNGRPALEKGGVMFADRETVEKVERMKVTTCLNPIHTALAVFGCLLGFERISQEMKDEDLQKLARGIGYKEGLPVVVNPGVLDPKKFIDTVIGVRLPNPFMPDTPQRIATDTSQKLPVRYGETIKSYQASDTLDVSSLNLIPLVQAAWMRYLMGVNDAGEAFELSPDPVLETLAPKFGALKLGEVTREDAEQLVLPLLHNETIFGVDLVEAGLSEKVMDDFLKLTEGVGAVRRTLKNSVAE